MCAMAKRINTMKIPDDPDLFILEFGVNDYQGQDHKVHIDHKTDIFFDGFQRLVMCCEIVIYQLLHKYPQAAIIFLEFQTAILNRKTAQLLHLGIAQHYHIPMISYGNTMFPHYYNLIHQLNATTYYSTHTNDTILSYPHGCQSCLLHHIVADFRSHGCKSICVYMERSGYSCNVNAPLPPNRQPCYVSFLSHDAVHPSVIGHQIAHDLIITYLASIAKDICIQQKKQQHDNANDKNNEVRIETENERWYIPKQIGFMASPHMIQSYSDYIVVKDTMEMFAEQDPLQASFHSTGFQLTGDGMADRKGWIATNPRGNETIEFIIDIIPNTRNSNDKMNENNNNCYVVSLSLLKSYENMGSFTIQMIDLRTNQTTSMKGDGLWEPHISIPADFIINHDDDNPVSCTGHCRIRLVTHPQHTKRNGNKVKIMTLAVRRCIRSSSSRNKNDPTMEWLPI
jgi:hypothetical protein